MAINYWPPPLVGLDAYELVSEYTSCLLNSLPFSASPQLTTNKRLFGNLDHIPNVDEPGITSPTLPTLANAGHWSISASERLLFEYHPLAPHGLVA